MSSVVAQVELVARLLEALPEKQPGFNNARLCAWLSSCALEMSLRQLQRYLCDLEQVGWVSRERHGKEDRWIRVHRGTKLIGFSRERAFALQLIQHKLQHLVPEQILNALKEEFQLASDTLRIHYPNERNWMGKIGEVPPLLQPANIPISVFGVVAEALLENKWLLVDYTNKQDLRRERKLMPLAIASKDGIYYLIARYGDSVENRQFRIDRIHCAQMLDEQFIPPDDFQLQDYLDEGFFNYPTGQVIELELIMDVAAAYHLSATPLSENQMLVTLGDGKVLVKAAVRESQRLIWWILGFGDLVRVIAPVDLAAKIESILAKSIDMYRE
ncbi:helix-turn-helix transcriptional regulator [Chitinibacter tainanensis]|uniref:helix-turn-helix transcriptional regulator n=1 Tax=Chitinibacter tainanensis TaxID=230667 RepID=UPI0004191E78|nr:WYL domain-containing protein [Chitinibacter tainanensis]